MSAAGSFETYVKERFGFTARHAFRLQAAAYCADTVTHGSVDASERTLRPLTKLIDLRVCEPTAAVERGIPEARPRRDRPSRGNVVRHFSAKGTVK